ncbi:MAG: type II secretion system F family protein [Nanoarchaeota archaeon]
MLKYAAVSIHPDRFVGFIAVFNSLLAIGISIYIALFYNTTIVPVAVLSFLCLQAFVYFFLLLRADAKAKFVEGILPDVLQLMASNLRAGFTADKAFLLSARPEFGPFQEEINKVGKEITLGKNIDDALIDMSGKTRSEKLSKTVELIISGLRSGGELASLLEQTAKNLRQEDIVDRRIKANVMMYVIFIFSAVCFGAPLLFGLSSFVVEVLTQSFGGINTSAAVSLPISFSESSIDIKFVVMFSTVFLITSSFLGSLVLGLIAKGKERDGLRFMPLLVGISVGFFFFIRFAIKGLIGSFFGF